MTQQSPPYALQAGSHGAELFRRAFGTLLGSAGGIVAAGDYAVTQNGTPNMSVNVAGGKPGGEIWVPGTSSSAQGPYYAFNDATVNLAIAASNPSNPRIDVPVVQVQDAAYAGAVNSASLAVVTGTPAGSPVAPSVPASSLALANVAVAALATTVVTGNITDKRVQAGAGSFARVGYMLGSAAQSGTASSTGVPSGLSVSITPPVPVKVLVFFHGQAVYADVVGQTDTFNGTIRVDGSNISTLGGGGTFATQILGNALGTTGQLNATLPVVCMGYTNLTAAAHTLDFNVTQLTNVSGGLQNGLLTYFAFPQ